MKKIMWVSLLSFFRVTIWPGVFAQAPGGISSGLTLWLQGDFGTTASGSDLTGWSDRTGINTFTLSAAKPVITANAINFHPAIRFANTDPVENLPTASLSGNTDIIYTDAYAVFKYALTSSSGTVLGGVEPGVIYGTGVFAGFGTAMYSGNGSFGVLSSFSYSNSGSFNIFNMDQSPAPPVDMIARVNGTEHTILANLDFISFVFKPMIGGTNNSGMNPDAGWPHFQGDLAELIVYNQSTEGNRGKIESYLALKYGITLGVPANTISYLASDGTVIWQGNSAYQNSIFGIGRDDASGLLVTQSNSMNHGTGDGIGKQGQGNIVLRNSSSPDNLEFLMIGNNNRGLTPENSDLPDDPIFNGKLRLGEQWQVQQTGNVGTIDLSFDANGVSLSGNLSDVSLLISEGDDNFTSGTFRVYNNPVPADNVITYSGITLNDNDHFTFVTNPSTPLPVGLVDFTVRHCGNNICLNWQTASENNNDHFQIERSADGRQFSVTGIVSGHGTTSIQQNYSFIDEYISPGKRYYRLKQVDVDKNFKYSKIVSVITDHDGALRIVPNPNDGSFIIKSRAASAGQVVMIDLFTSDGKNVHHQVAEMNKTISTNLPKGFYTAVIVSKKTIYREKIVIR